MEMCFGMRKRGEEKILEREEERKWKKKERDERNTSQVLSYFFFFFFFFLSFRWSGVWNAIAKNFGLKSQGESGPICQISLAQMMADKKVIIAVSFLFSRSFFSVFLGFLYGLLSGWSPSLFPYLFFVLSLFGNRW
jgi:hypothetical protein